jgi:tRNA splicing endonuclease
LENSQEVIQIRTVIESGKLRLVKCLSERLCNKLEEYGKIKDNILDIYEAGFLAYKGMLEVDGKRGEDAFEKILPLIDDFLVFQVYLDLRKKGKKVIRGPVRRSLLLIEGAHVYEIHVLGEGELTTPRDMVKLAEYSSANARHPVVAIVDSTGIITYYTMRKSDSIK